MRVDKVTGPSLEGNDRRAGFWLFFLMAFLLLLQLAQQKLQDLAVSLTNFPELDPHAKRQLGVAHLAFNGQIHVANVQHYFQLSPR